MLFACYRMDQYSDPDGFMVQMAMVLSEYPEDVVNRVTDPRTGLQRSSKFPPSIAEIVKACESAKKIIAGLRYVAEKKALGYEWDSNRNRFVKHDDAPKLTKLED